MSIRLILLEAVVLSIGICRPRRKLHNFQGDALRVSQIIATFA